MGRRSLAGPIKDVALSLQVAEARRLFVEVPEAIVGGGLNSITDVRLSQSASHEKLERAAAMCEDALRRDPEHCDAIAALVEIADGAPSHSAAGSRGLHEVHREGTGLVRSGAQA